MTDHITIPAQARFSRDHLPAMFARIDANGRASVEKTLQELSKRRQVFGKLSEVLRIVDGKPATIRLFTNQTSTIFLSCSEKTM